MAITSMKQSGEHLGIDVSNKRITKNHKNNNVVTVIRCVTRRDVPLSCQREFRVCLLHESTLVFT